MNAEFVADMVFGAFMAGPDACDPAYRHYVQFMAKHIGQAYMDVFSAEMGRRPSQDDSASLFRLLVSIHRSRGLTRIMSRDSLRYFRLVKSSINPALAEDWPGAMPPNSQVRPKLTLVHNCKKQQA